MWELKPFPNPQHQHFFELLKRGDLESLKHLDYDALTQEELPFCPHYVFDAYYSRYSECDYLEMLDFLKAKGFVERQTPFTENLGWVIYDLMMACDEKPDIEYVKAYLKAGHDVHKYNPNALFAAIYVKNFEIVTLLIEGGSDLSKFSYFIQRMLSAEFDYYVAEHIDAKNIHYHMDAERVLFCIQHGAVINSRDFVNFRGKTSLDLAKEYGHWPTYEVLKAHGGKFASELEDA